MWLGAYNRYNKNNYDVTYYFGKDHGMDSFIRFYDQRETYWGSFGGGDGDPDTPVPFSPNGMSGLKHIIRAEIINVGIII